MRRYLFIVLTWISLVAIFALVGFIILKPSSDYDLATQGIRTKGIVIVKEPENHRIVRYSYVVDNKSYEGIGHGGAGNPSFDNLNTGSAVLVFYNPRNPVVSAMGYPQ